MACSLPFYKIESHGLFIKYFGASAAGSAGVSGEGGYFMKESAVVFFVISLLVLSGCGTWKNDRFPERNFQADWNQCLNDAAEAYPKLSRYIGDEEECETTYDSIWKREIVTCHTYPVYVDDNVQPRRDMAECCIVDGGWEFRFFQFENGVYFIPLWVTTSKAYQ
jgi:hypothetical protein